VRCPPPLVLTSAVPATAVWRAAGAGDATNRRVKVALGYLEGKFEEHRRRKEKEWLEQGGGAAPRTTDVVKAPFRLPEEGSLGRLVDDFPDPVPLLTHDCEGDGVLPSVEGDVLVFEGGLVYRDSRLGPLPLRFAEGIDKIDVVSLSGQGGAAADGADGDGESLPESTVLVLTLRPEAVDSDGWACYGALSSGAVGGYAPSGMNFDIGLVFSGRNHAHLHSTVLPRWKRCWSALPSHLDVLVTRGTELESAGFKRAHRSALIASFGRMRKRYHVAEPDGSVEDFLAEFQRRDLDLALPLLSGLRDQAASRQGPAEPRLTVVCGLPGSGKHALCASLVRSTGGDGVTWTVFSQGMGKGYQFNAEEVSLRFKQAAASADGPGRTSSASRRILLVLPGHTPLDVAVPALVELGLPSPETCVAVVDACGFWRPDGFVRPGLDVLAQIGWGSADCVVLTNCDEVREEDLGNIKARIRAHNPEAAFVHAGRGGRLRRAGDAETLLKPRVPAGARAWLRAVGGDQGNAACGKRAAIHVVARPSSGDISGVAILADRLVVKLGELFAADEWARPLDALDETGPRRVESLKGFVRERAGGHMLLVETQHKSSDLLTSRQTVRSFKIDSSGEGLLSGSFEGGAADLMKREGPFFEGLVCIGLNSEVVEHGAKELLGKLKALLLECQEEVPWGELPLLSDWATDLSTEELHAIKGEHMDEPLPEGVFSNGSVFVDAFGDKSEWHPRMDEFCADLLARKNADLVKRNAEIRERIDAWAPLDVEATLLLS